MIKAVKPLIEQAEKILYETNGSIKGADPDSRLTNRANRHAADHKATPEEQRLAAALKIVRFTVHRRLKHTLIAPCR